MDICIQSIKTIHMKYIPALKINSLPLEQFGLKEEEGKKGFYSPMNEDDSYWGFDYDEKDDVYCFMSWGIHAEHSEERKKQVEFILEFYRLSTFVLGYEMEFDCF